MTERFFKRKEVDIIGHNKWWINHVNEDIDDHSTNHNKSYILIDIWNISELLVIAQWHFQATWSTISFPENYVAWKIFIGIDFHILTQYKLVFGLGRIFRLERSAIFMTEFRARLELGAINFHRKPCMFVYMGEKRFPLWSYHIGTVLKRIQLSFDIYRVSNHQLVHDIHQMVGGLHNLYKFQWSITSCLSYVEYWPENIKTCLPPCGG